MGLLKIKWAKAKLVGQLEDLSRRLKKFETSAVKKKNYGHKQTTENHDSKKSVLPNIQAKPNLYLMSRKITDKVF